MTTLALSEMPASCSVVRGSSPYLSQTGKGLEFADHSADRCCFDLMLPGIAGIDSLPQIRTESGVPIVMLTAKSDNSSSGPGTRIPILHVMPFKS